MADLADILRDDVLDKRELINSMSAAEVVAELPSILNSQDEDIVCKALDLLKLICEANRESSRLLVSTALYAFENGSPDVHARAIDLLKRFAAPLDEAYAEELRQRLDMIDSSQRPAAEALLATAGGALYNDLYPIIDDATSGAGEKIDELVKEYDDVDEHWRELAGCTNAIKVVRGEERLVKRTTFGALDVVRLDPFSKFQSVKDPDVLVDLFMRGFNTQLSEAEIERVLDGAARIARPEGQDDYWDARLTALRARAKNEGGFLSMLALAWAFGLDPDADQYFENLIHKRVNAMATQLAKGNPVHLLATPTHSGLWIDARVLVARVQKLNDVDLDTTDVEQVQSLLRLAPEHRQEALSEARSLKGEFASALRYALGSDDEEFGDNLPVWVAAIRARSPLTEPYCMKVKLAARQFPSVGKCLCPDSFHTESTKTLADYVDTRTGSHEMVALIGDMDIGNIKSPLCTEVHWARQFREVSENRESANNYWQEDEWAQLYDPDLQIGGMAIHALIYGLTSACPEVRLISINILNRAILDGRIDGAILGTTISHHFSDLQPKLWLNALHGIAKTSPLHLQVVHDVLETIVGIGPIPDDNPYLPLLNELFELSSKIGCGITGDTARNYLHALKGGGTSEKLAKDLLELPQVSTTENLRLAGAITLKQRLKRAKRWQAWHNATLATGSPH